MAKGRYKPNVDHTFYTKCASSRHGATPKLIVVHDTEGANAPGIKDLVGLGLYWDTTWNTPRASSSHVGVDNEGNSARYVRDHDKAWTQAFYNPWGLSIENIGIAGQTEWSELMYKENARWIAYWCHLWGIRPYLAQVTTDGRIIKPGYIRHRQLGFLGGNHLDPPMDFDLAHVGSMARSYLKNY
jgi:hypothetical protein